MGASHGWKCTLAASVLQRTMNEVPLGARVHLINPSNVSFGVAVITPRWLYVLAAATGTAWGDPADRRRNARNPGPRIDPGRRRRRHRHPHRQRAARLRDRPAGARARRLGRVRRHPRHAVPGRGARARRGARGRARATATSSGRRSSPTASPGTPQPLYDGGRVSGEQFVLGALGSAARRAATCGRRCRPCAAARSTARSARCGAPTARSRGSAASTASCSEIVELRRLGFRFIALADDNFYPVTLDDLATARAAIRPTRLHELEALRAGALRADGAARAAAGRLVFYTQITMEAAEDPSFLDAMQARAHPRRAGRRRVGDRCRLEGRLQGLQPGRRRAGGAAAARSASTASTCSARSSSGCRATTRTRSTRPSRWPSRPTSRSRSSCC